MPGWRRHLAGWQPFWAQELAASRLASSCCSQPRPPPCVAHHQDCCCEHSPCYLPWARRRTEMMSREVAERCVALMEASCSSSSSSSGSTEAAGGSGGGSVRVVDLTGGAPELTPQFRCGTPLCTLQLV